MAMTYLLTFFLFTLSFPFAISLATSVLSQGSFLSVEKNDVLLSPNGIFSAGFYSVGFNAYCFAIWFSKPCHQGKHTIVWMANRDEPVNGRHSKLSVLETGNIILTDAGQSIVWSTDIVSVSGHTQLQLLNSGNLVLQTLEGRNLWQSFDFPTDTLLPDQQLTMYTKLVSARSKSNCSSGYYNLLYDHVNVLRLIFDGPETSTIYWPDPWLVDEEHGRLRDNDSRVAMFDSSGHFLSSDKVEFRSIDYGRGPWRRLTLDYDGNLRLNTFEDEKGIWSTTWQAISKPCRINGACGPNSVCLYEPGSGRKCSCPKGFRLRNKTDWSYGCAPEFDLSCRDRDVTFVKLDHVGFYGYNYKMPKNFTLQMCVESCLELCCPGFQYRFFKGEGVYRCYIKRELRNGHHSLNFNGTFYLKVPKSVADSYSKGLNFKEFKLHCANEKEMRLDRAYYHKKVGNGSLKILLWCVIVIGSLETICMLLVLGFMYKTRKKLDTTRQGYIVATTRFQRFSYNELKRATKGFREVIGRGGSGVVYRGILSNKKVAAIKRLNIEANQGEEEFLAEVSIIERINHVNLIEMLGYCAEGKHRLLVFEYMENGSLAQNLMPHLLDWQRRYEIAVGTAKGLAYLHEECLEWVLHCDIKPQNILLHSNYEPKVSDFGLSKLLKRDNGRSSMFSKIRGTRGYMAPEWVNNLPITSKVDVYSYGIVVLEMVIGRNQATGVTTGDVKSQNLVEWVREKKNTAVSGSASWIEEVVEPALGHGYDRGKIETLVEVAIRCTEIDRLARPTMSQVVQLLTGERKCLALM